MASGKSSSERNRTGVRRTNKQGQELAPRSARRKGRRLLSDCSQDDLKKAGLSE